MSSVFSSLSHFPLIGYNRPLNSDIGDHRYQLFKSFCGLFNHLLYICTYILNSTYNLTKMKICVFCSANDNMTEKYGALAEALGRWAAKEGHTIVYGGCNTGLMESVAAAAKRHGGHTIGVVPTKVEERGRLSEHVDVHIPCDNLNDRKALMMAQSDVFVALPGGIGTLDEIFSVVASATIGYHQKTTYLLSNDNFWEPLIHLLDNMQQQGLMRQPWNQYLKPFVWKG